MAHVGVNMTRRDEPYLEVRVEGGAFGVDVGVRVECKSLRP